MMKNLNTTTLFTIICLTSTHQSCSTFMYNPPTTKRLIFSPPLSSSSTPKKTFKNPSSHLFAGGGFGSTSNSKKKHSPPSTNAKTRTVSGHTGSGTKPLRKAANTFDLIHKKYGKDATSDVYVRSPLQDETLYWFVGKVARWLSEDEDEIAGRKVPTEVEAVLSQKRLILEYAKQLRPQNLGGGYGKALEVWLAPGDSEMDVVQNKITLKKVSGTVSEISDDFSVADVGYNPEIYVGDEIKEGGLRVRRDEEGRPVKAVFDINQ